MMSPNRSTQHLTAPVEVKQLSFSFAEPVLTDLNLAFEPGTLTAILGPNGAGKSTLIRLISGWYRPARGAVTLFGQDSRTLNSARRARLIAVVEQENALTTDITVREMVALGRLPHQSLLATETEDDRRAIQTALERTNALSLVDRQLSTLSGGERQRTRIAAALAQEAQVLILDEPTAHLDIRHQIELLSLLRHLVFQGLTVIAVLHDINLASLYSDTLVFLSQGRVIARGSPADVVTEQVVSSVYECPVVIFDHPVSHLPQVALLAK
jgi:iron complex transport system ATP-binding protein